MKWIIAGCCLVAYGVCTGGLSVTTSRDFGGQRAIHLVDGLDADIYLDSEVTQWSILFLGHYYASSEPFDLRLQVWDRSMTTASIEIDEVVVKYADGETIVHTEKWIRELKPYTQHNSSSDGVIETEMMMMSDSMKDPVARHSDVTLTVSGRLIRSDGEEVEFSASESFKAADDFRITTYWREIADV